MTTEIISPKFIEYYKNSSNEARNILEQFFMKKSLVERIDNARIDAFDIKHMVLSCTLVGKTGGKLHVQLTLLNSEEES